MNNQLYENIMSKIAKSVKNAINENIDLDTYYECVSPVYFGDFLIEYNKDNSIYKKYIAKEVLDDIVKKCPEIYAEILNKDTDNKWYVFYGTDIPKDNFLDDKELHASLKRSGESGKYGLQTLGLGIGDFGYYIYNSGIYAYIGTEDLKHHNWAIIAPYTWWHRRGLLI